MRRANGGQLGSTAATTRHCDRRKIDFFCKIIICRDLRDRERRKWVLYVSIFSLQSAHLSRDLYSYGGFKHMLFYMRPTIGAHSYHRVQNKFPEAS